MAKKRSKKSKKDNLAALAADKWCIIDGLKLQGMTCPRHGVVRFYLSFDPLAVDAFVDHCDDLGIVELEASC